MQAVGSSEGEGSWAVQAERELLFTITGVLEAASPSDASKVPERQNRTAATRCMHGTFLWETVLLACMQVRKCPSPVLLCTPSRLIALRQDITSRKRDEPQPLSKTHCLSNAIYCK